MKMYYSKLILFLILFATTVVLYAYTRYDYSILFLLSLIYLIAIGSILNPKKKNDYKNISSEVTPSKIILYIFINLLLFLASISAVFCYFYLFIIFLCLATISLIISSKINKNSHK
jgi:hypothetical protein